MNESEVPFARPFFAYVVGYMLRRRDVVVVVLQVLYGIGLLCVYIAHMDRFLWHMDSLKRVKSDHSQSQAALVTLLSVFYDDSNRRLAAAGSIMAYLSGALGLVAYSGPQRWLWAGVVTGISLALMAANRTHARGMRLHEHSKSTISDFDDVYVIYLYLICLSVFLTVTSSVGIRSFPTGHSLADQLWKPLFAFGYLMASTSVICGAKNYLGEYSVPLLLTMGSILLVLVAVYFLYVQILFLVEPDRNSETNFELSNRLSLEEKRPELEMLSTIYGNMEV